MKLKLLDVLRRRPKVEILHGVVITVNTGDTKVKVIMDNGVKQWIRYDESNMIEPKIGDKMLIGGDAAKFIIRRVDRSIPKDTSILVV